MIEHYVGAGPFRDGVNAYLKAHAYGNATSEDFWKTIAATSGKAGRSDSPDLHQSAGRADPRGVAAHLHRRRTALARLQPGTLSVHAATRRADDDRWQVPACFKAGTSTDSSACLVVSQPRVTLDVAQGCAPWIFANAGAQGYYRTAYAPEMLRSLAPHLGTALTAPERLSLIDDEWALVRANRHNAGTT